MKKWFVAFLLLTSLVGLSQPRVHPNAHAHNDYAHRRPLFDALENGFISVEADVHLKDGKLLVSHNEPGSSAKSLEELYLKPLDSLRIKNGGWIYPQTRTPVLLLIDIKTDAEETFQFILQALLIYEQCLNTTTRKSTVQVLISGNRPYDLIRNDPSHFSSIDGRPEDLGKDYSSDIMPLISENYNKIMKWNGIGTPTPDELIKLKELANRVHAEHKKLRLWATPDNETTWRVLLSAGVDLINTDKLRELNLFLISKNL